MNEMFSIEGKVAVISGAAGALGGSLARHFASQGADVVALVHRPEQLDPTVEALRRLGGNPCGYACNVMDTGALKGIAAEVCAKYGRVDILINVAGGNVAGANVMPDQNFWDMKLEDWDKVLDLNLNGTVYPCHVFAEIFARQGYGNILNISSMAAYDALSRVAGYGAAKEGVSNFTRWLAAEMAVKYGERRLAFCEIVDEAEKRGKLLMLTTNLSLEEISQKYGERTMDRLVAITRRVKFEGNSLRR